MRYLMGIDLGGGSSKATLINEKGEIVSSAVEEYSMFYPHKGWAEQDMEEIYRASVKNIKTIIERSQVNSRDIKAISFDGGTHIAVLLDDKNNVIRPAIYWSDSRSVEESAELKAIKDELMELSYNSPGPIWTLPQMMWIKRHEPENFKRIVKVLFLKDYVRYRFTGKMASDSIEVMGAMMRDEPKNDWSDKLLALCGLNRDQMPQVLDPADIAGTPLPEICAETGLSPDTLVAVGATDTAMEVYAAGNIKEGNTTIKLATAGRICPVTQVAYPHPQLVCYRHVIPGLWYPGTATKTCAQSMRWYRDVLGQFEINEAKHQGTDAYTLIGNEAADISAGSDNLFFHPYLQGELTPYQNTKLKASFTGISSYHTKAHFGRAVMEGVAYSLNDCMEVLRQLKIPMDDTLRIIGGGSKSPIWRQIVSDVIDMPMERVITDDSSIGSAMLAGVASGVFSSFEESVAVCSKTAEIVLPIKENVRIYKEKFKVYKEIQAALESIYNKL